MAKFYVQSGQCQQIVQADSADQAALWAIHLAMETLLPIDELDWIECDGLGIVKYENGFLPLEAETLVSERGFGRDEAGKFETIDLLNEWNQLLVALARIDRMIADQDEDC
jgi:hypothetical protein